MKKLLVGAAAFGCIKGPSGAGKNGNPGLTATRTSSPGTCLLNQRIAGLSLVWKASVRFWRNAVCARRILLMRVISGVMLPGWFQSRTLIS